jgi:hypothetical protein
MDEDLIDQWLENEEEWQPMDEEDLDSDCSTEIRDEEREEEKTINELRDGWRRFAAARQMDWYQAGDKDDDAHELKRSVADISALLEYAKSKQ